MEAYTSGSFMSHVLTSDAKKEGVGKATTPCRPGWPWEERITNVTFAWIGKDAECLFCSSFLDSEHEQHHLLPFGQSAERGPERRERGTGWVMGVTGVTGVTAAAVAAPHPARAAATVRGASWPVGSCVAGAASSVEGEHRGGNEPVGG